MPRQTDDPLYIGHDFDGQIDELRITAGARSDDWLLVQFAAGDDRLLTLHPAELLP